MPPLSLTRKHIDQACVMRARGGSDGACARHAGVAPATFFTWLHYGEIIADYLENGNELLPKEHYRTWMSSATVMLAKVQRELEMTGGSLSKEHKLYLKLWNGMREATDAFVVECQLTIDKAKDVDPSWALKGLRWFHPEEYREPSEAAQAMTELANRESASILAATEQSRLGADQIAAPYVNLYRDIRNRGHVTYVINGGRLSAKSSFVSQIGKELIENNPNMHGLVVRKYANTLSSSVYNQLQWAIAQAGDAEKYHGTTSPVEITKIDTGQKIYFRGADDPMKIKSIKVPFGAIGFLWFEELDQFAGEAEIRSIIQSAIRGTDTAYIFMTFNPPQSKQNWANKFVQTPKDGQLVTTTNYLDIPREWIGSVALQEAESLKQINPIAYEHEYMGVPNSSGGVIFPNVEVRRITDDEIASFDRTGQGIDWGFAVDPLDWGRSAYDRKKQILYIYDEFRALGMGNRALYEVLVNEKGVQPNDLIIADSAEPKSIADMVSYGLCARGVEKFPDSVRYMMKWLASRAKIVIDPVRCPYATKEFTEYEYERTKDGEIISAYPDKNDHSIARVAYTWNLEWRQRGR